MKRRVVEQPSGLRAALIAKEEAANANTPWRQHRGDRFHGPASLLGRLRAGEPVDLPGWRLGKLVPGLTPNDWARIEADATLTRIDRPGAP